MRVGTRWAGLVLLALLTLLAALRFGALPLTDGAQGAGEAGRSAAGARAEAAAEAEAPVPLPAQERYEVIAERPLFMPTRRPPEPPPEQPVAASARPSVTLPPPELEVHAIVREGERWFAMLSRSRVGDFVQASPGDVVHGWTVTSIEAEAVELSSGARSVRLLLRPETR